MSFLAPKAPALPDPVTPPSPTNEAVRRSAEIARRRRVRSGRASTLLTRGGGEPNARLLGTGTIRGSSTANSGQAGFGALASNGLRFNQSLF